MTDRLQDRGTPADWTTAEPFVNEPGNALADLADEVDPVNELPEGPNPVN